MQTFQDASRLFSTDLFAAGLGLLGLLLAGTLTPRLAQAQSPTPVTSIVNGASGTTLEVNYSGGLLAPGKFADLPNYSAPNDSIPATGAGTRMMWYPEKAAFRAGRVGAFKDGTQWDAGKVGKYSVALGLDTEANSFAATAMGLGTTASGASATAMGEGTAAVTTASLSIGQFNSANTSSDGTLFVAGNGSSGSRSDALVLDTDGNMTAAGKIETESAGIELPDGTVLSGNEDLGVPTNSNGAFDLSNGDGIVASGTEGSGSIPATGAGTRMMWYPAKAAFRAGRVGDNLDGTQWDAANVGDYSAAFGRDTKASGFAATAMGNASTASDVYAMAMGSSTTASAAIATAMGASTTASDQVATAMGSETTAAGIAATAMGSQTTAGNNYATAMGFDTEANGGQSTAMGDQTLAEGFAATAMGSLTRAFTPKSLSIGGCNSANTSEDNTLFVVGNGTESRNACDSRSDALVLSESGTLTISGSLNENSDRRLKTQIEPLGSGILQKLGELRPVRYRFKDQKTHPSGAQIGLIAQDVRKEFPALVSKGSRGYLSLAYPKMTAVLLRGIQEQQTTVKQQRARIDSLKARVDRLERLQKRVAELESRSGTSRLAGLPGSRLLIGLLLGGLVGAGLLWRRRRRPIRSPQKGPARG